ncbi:substrate-binding domain-containing protein [Rossellomorea aquimaris]|uniref:ABC transporter substrate-binding protein n=1 Tax=Rossellomorea aquimaris TaxID=189382 RepID=A0A5D4UG00_9BACI|nr:substrate-binding domain-containing protein [Rossellomorea aquimaris]TYS80602.1 ABC transporter substrate-binding protein [Rossellomorea aquimaris]TYS85989.1 ABC transporter substrate-binding protein [Rossellomorea aquimaris]
MMLMSCMLIAASACSSESSGGSGDTDEKEQETVKIGVLASLTGALESYGEQTQRGFELGLEYATDGTMEVAGKKIEVVFEDTETKPEVAVQKATKLLEEDGVDFLVGSSSSGDTLAVLPLAEEYEKIMIVEPAVADSITGSEFNPYIFRTARNSSQDAVAGAAAIAKDGVKIATLAPDYSFGRDGVAAFKEAAEGLGAEIVLEEYADPAATDFTSNIQKVIDSKPDYLFVIWAGANSPWNQIGDMKLQEKGIKISTGAPDIAALSAMEPLVGMEGFSVYYHELPDNDINDWLVEEHKEKYDGDVPDLFTPGGMSSAISIVEAIKKTEGDLDSDTLIETMEGMSFDTPKGTMTFREEDHQALQTLYAIKLEKKEGVPYPVPVLIRELSPEETAPPIRN